MATSSTCAWLKHVSMLEHASGLRPPTVGPSLRAAMVRWVRGWGSTLTCVLAPARAFKFLYTVSGDSPIPDARTAM